jgi:uncharacterized protein
VLAGAVRAGPVRSGTPRVNMGCNCRGAADRPGSMFVVPVADRWLLYAGLSGGCALMNSAAVASVAAGSDLGLPGLLDLLASESQANVPSGPSDYMPAFLGLVVTRQCNLSCEYCAFGAASSHHGAMDPAIAVTAIEWMADLARQSGSKSLNVELFGGEPFVARSVVDIVVHKARMAAAEQGLTPSLGAITNGVFDKDYAQFVGEYFDVVTLSLDGNASFHDRYRHYPGGRGSFHEVCRTARILSESSADLILRACVTSENVGSLAETAAWFCEEFRPLRIAFEPLDPVSIPGRLELRPPDPHEFAVNYALAQEAASAWKVEVVYSGTPLERVRCASCPAGNDGMIVLPDGSISACYLPEHEWQRHGLDLGIGTVKGLEVDIDRAAVVRLRQSTQERPRCERCFCRWSCGGGCYVKHSSPGCPADYDDYCVQTRLIAAAQLLEGLGESDLAGRILTNRAAGDALARHSSDRLQDWSRA